MKAINRSLIAGISLARRSGTLSAAANWLIPQTGLLLAVAANALAQPTITTQPQSQSISLGANVMFRMAALGEPPLLYQWRHNDINIPAATMNPLALTNAQTSDAGDYSVIVSDNSGSVTSKVAVLEVDPTFTKITSGSIVTEKGEFTACAWADYDRDGYPDLFVNNRIGANLLYRNNGDGTFAKMTNANLVWDTGTDHLAGLWGDYDNDGFLDLLAVNGGLAGNGHVVLYHNEGDGTFSRPSATLLGGIATRTSAFHGAAWADYDMDGLLDVLVTDMSSWNYLYRNLGGSRFEVVSNTNGQAVAFGSSGAETVWADYDNDGDPDVFVLSLGAPSLLYRNDGGGRFTPGPILTPSLSGGGCSWADFNNDGLFDLFVAFLQRRNELYANAGDGSFLQITNRSPALGTDTYGGAWGDYDNDGWLDLFVGDGSSSSSQRQNSLYHNLGDGFFEKVLSGSPANDRARTLASAWSDYDNDGFLDLFVANGFYGVIESNFLYRNNCNSNSWLKVRCNGTTSNRAGIGARVRVSAVIKGQRRTQLRQIDSSDGRSGGSLEAHFGLGDAAVIDWVQVEWPSGAVQKLSNVRVKQTLTVTEAPRIVALNEDGRLRMSLPGGKGFVYEILRSTDLTNWSSAATLMNTNGTLTYTDSDAANAPRQFYRVIVK